MESLGNGWWIIIENEASDASAIVTLDPSTTETINGQRAGRAHPRYRCAPGRRETAGNFNMVTLQGVVTPKDLYYDLISWYDASDTASITDAGAGAVSQLNDKSGNGNHLVQATGGSRPTTGTRTINGLNVLDFDGTADTLGDAAVDGQVPVQAYVVGETDTVAGSRHRGQVGELLPVPILDDGAIYFGSTAVGTVTNTVAVATPWLMAGYDRGTSDIIRSAGTMDSGNAGVSWSTDRRLHRLQRLGGDFWNGTIAEIIVVNKVLPAYHRSGYPRVPR